MQKVIIIVAGGKGLRMGQELPKQFLPIGGKPVLMHTIEAFYKADKEFRIVLVLPESQQSYWTDLCSQFKFNIGHSLAIGGETRFHSVKNGLTLATALWPGDAIIGIHDGVRPFVSAEVIDRCFQMASTSGSVIPVVEVFETIRQLENGQSKTVNRSSYRLVQTPQVFQSEVLLKAYQQPFDEHFTDDASVVEAMGVAVKLTDGNRENIKITAPFDLVVAEAILSAR